MTLVMALVSLFAAIAGCALALMSLARLIEELFGDDGSSVPSDNVLELEGTALNASASDKPPHDSTTAAAAGGVDEPAARLSGV